MGGATAYGESAVQPETRLVQQPELGTPTPSKDKPARSAAVPVAGKRICGPPYITGDPDLGPTILPRTGYLGALLHGYVPLGGLSPQHFLSRYWDYAQNNYRFPPDSGFGRSGNFPNGRLLLKTTILQPGMKLDRFGSNAGAFLAPIGDLFIRRGLPPRNLNTNSMAPMNLCNYHAFEVLKSFGVEVGPAAPAFQMPGGGTQYHVISRLVPGFPQTNDEVPVSVLVTNGFLAEINPFASADLVTTVK
ncbi:TNT domain-containing protein [Nonomuraea wenchangensis]|uniref:TNT domain-containing protein n=1 Tax=Nonomuraea wenchangensis TaxID=568860 RepID=UPI0033C5D852